jgi:hypothetical protein
MAETPDLSAVRLRLSRPVYRYHQYQGLTNDCGPTSVAIAVNAMLEQNLHADRLTMVVMGEPWRWEKRKYVGWAHVKILFGRALDGRFLFVDPGCSRSLDSDTLEGHGLFAQDEVEFLRQWRNLLRLYVEVEDGLDL